MNFVQVLQRLNDLPQTFLRPLDTTFVSWINALAAGLARGTLADDSMTSEIINVNSAQFGWVDVWGLLFGIQRLAGVVSSSYGQADSQYIQAIQYILNAGGGTPCGIAAWIYALFGVEVTIAENLPVAGYVINFPSGLNTNQITAILVSIARVRPAGVPILGINIQSTGLYLNTINFLGATNTTGAYLINSAMNSASGYIGAATNNLQPLLPTLLLTDPVLNSESY